MPELPSEVDSFGELLPLEDLRSVSAAYGGNASSVYKVRNQADGFFYCMQRIHGEAGPKQRQLPMGVF